MPFGLNKIDPITDPMHPNNVDLNHNTGRDHGVNPPIEPAEVTVEQPKTPLEQFLEEAEAEWAKYAISTDSKDTDYDHMGLKEGETVVDLRWGPPMDNHTFRYDSDAIKKFPDVKEIRQLLMRNSTVSVIEEDPKILKKLWAYMRMAGVELGSMQTFGQQLALLIQGMQAAREMILSVDGYKVVHPKIGEEGSFPPLHPDAAYQLGWAIVCELDGVQYQGHANILEVAKLAISDPDMQSLTASPEHNYQGPKDPINVAENLRIQEIKTERMIFESVESERKRKGEAIKNIRQLAELATKINTNFKLSKKYQIPNNLLTITEDTANVDEQDIRELVGSWTGIFNELTQLKASLLEQIAVLKRTKVTAFMVLNRELSTARKEIKRIADMLYDPRNYIAITNESIPPIEQAERLESWLSSIDGELGVGKIMADINTLNINSIADFDKQINEWAGLIKTSSSILEGFYNTKAKVEIIRGKGLADLTLYENVPFDEEEPAEKVKTNVEAKYNQLIAIQQQDYLPQDTVILNQTDQILLHDAFTSTILYTFKPSGVENIYFPWLMDANSTSRDTSHVLWTNGSWETAKRQIPPTSLNTDFFIPAARLAAEMIRGNYSIEDILDHIKKRDTRTINGSDPQARYEVMILDLAREMIDKLGTERVEAIRKIAA